MSNKQAKAVLVKRKNVKEKNEKPTFPALYQYKDGSIFLLTSKNNAICLIDTFGAMELGEHLPLFENDFENDFNVIWTRLPSNKAIKIFNQ